MRLIIPQLLEKIYTLYGSLPFDKKLYAYLV